MPIKLYVVLYLHIQDINECQDPTLNDCHSQATCQNNPGDFSCACNLRWSGNGTFCEDINECLGVNACSDDATCQNAPGSYVCTCNNGFNGNGITCIGKSKTP